MFRLNQVFSIKAIAAKLQAFANRRPAQISDEPLYRAPRIDNPWQEDLDRLVQDRVRKPVNVEDEVGECLAHLSQAVQEVKDYSQAQILEEERLRRQRATRDTAHDLKAWWGEAIGTLEPAPPPDTPEQKSRQRAIERWFYS